MNIGFVFESAAKLADDVVTVPKECVDQNRRVGHEDCAIREGIGHRQVDRRILLVLRLVEYVVGDYGAEVVLVASVVVRYAHGDGHIL